MCACVCGERVEPKIDTTHTRPANPWNPFAAQGTNKKLATTCGVRRENGSLHLSPSCLLASLSYAPLSFQTIDAIAVVLKSGCSWGGDVCFGGEAIFHSNNDIPNYLSWAVGRPEIQWNWLKSNQSKCTLIEIYWFTYTVLECLYWIIYMCTCQWEQFAYWPKLMWLASRVVFCLFVVWAVCFDCAH